MKYLGRASLYYNLANVLLDYLVRLSYFRGLLKPPWLLTLADCITRQRCWAQVAYNDRQLLSRQFHSFEFRLCERQDEDGESL